jgi:hypothetical protein
VESEPVTELDESDGALVLVKLAALRGMAMDAAIYNLDDDEDDPANVRVEVKPDGSLQLHYENWLGHKLFCWYAPPENAHEEPPGAV